MLKLDISDTRRLKAIGILAIVLHNFFRPTGVVRENEFLFDPARVATFASTVIDPRHTIQALFAYFGHFGVQLFIFLSAYGLAVKYWDAPAGPRFIFGRMKKLYPVLLLSMAAWLLLDGAANGGGPVGAVQRHGWELACVLLGIGTLVPGIDLAPVGPWWFVSFIFQAYCLWAALRWFTARAGRIGLALLAVAGTVTSALVNPLLAGTEINLLETPIGHLPEICFGIAAARYAIRLTWPLALGALVAFALSNLHKAVWLLGFPAALVLMLWAYQQVREKMANTPTLERIGDSSRALFLINGVVRLPLVALAISLGTWWIVLGLGCVHAAIATGIADGLTPRRKMG